MATTAEAQADLSEFAGGERGEGTTQITIIMDERERTTDLKALLEEMGAKVRQQVLNVGDFILSDRVVVERKTRADFENSIIDGRLFNQAGAMAQFPKPLLIIEGESFEARVNRNALLGAIASLMLDFNIVLFFTYDQKATAELLYALAKREQMAEKRPLRLKGDKRAYTLDEQRQMLVECLPNVGPRFAQALLKRFGSVEAIVNATEKELGDVKRMGLKRARLIRRLLSEKWKEGQEEETYGTSDAAGRMTLKI